ncbi:ABC transporter substrate-binding protein [Arthrobacter sp. MW3 TE3886]|uniref:ABC transporter substrate-binding protein n=1 Tax=Arthrobacter sp. MW3 TE3886 TaxID=3156254 RepID=UPI0035171D90
MKQQRLSITVRIASLATAALMGLTACASSQAAAPAPGSAVVSPPAKLVSSGTLSYGVAATFPPFEYKDGTTLTGFDVEMAQALAGSMGLTASPLDIDFDGLIPALNGSRIDVINSAMYINEARSAQVDFVPYLVVGEAMLVPAGNKNNIKKIPEDLSGRTIAVTRGAIGEKYMTEFNDELKSMGKEPMEIMALPTNQDALLAVKTGRADGFDTSTPGAAYTLTRDKGAFEVAGTFKVGTKIGIAVRKGDTQTKSAIEAALKEFVDKGAYKELVAKYNLPADSSIFG